MRRVFITSLVCLGIALAACGDLSEFKGEFEDGAIIQGNFVRSCFGEKTRATLKFDPDRAVAPVGDAARLNTLTTTDGTFDHTPLVPITALPHDALSELDFPGAQRLRNFVLLARPEKGPLAGRDATVVVSLLDGGAIEARVIGRTALGSERCEGEAVEKTPSEEPRIREYFGVFRFKAQ